MAMRGYGLWVVVMGIYGGDGLVASTSYLWDEGAVVYELQGLVRWLVAEIGGQRLVD